MFSFKAQGFFDYDHSAAHSTPPSLIMNREGQTPLEPLGCSSELLAPVIRPSPSRQNVAGRLTPLISYHSILSPAHAWEETAHTNSLSLFHTRTAIPHHDDHVIWQKKGFPT